MNKVQLILKEGQPEYAVLPYDLYTQLVEDAEMLQDIRDYDEVMARIESGEEEIIPAHVPYAIIDGENPVKVWREYRGLTQQELAEAKSRVSGVCQSRLRAAFSWGPQAGVNPIQIKERGGSETAH